MSASSRECLDYIEKYWEKITFHRPRSGVFYLGLPYRAVSPNDTRFRDNLFYWDSYFIILGLVVSGRVDLAKEIVENFACEMETYGFIPVQNRRRAVFLGKTNPPFLTRMIFEVYRKTRDDAWLSRMIAGAKKEYNEVWHEAGRRFIPEFGLSRYSPKWASHLRAEYESGWDLTSRFDGRCLDILPVDLNSCLFRYELDFAEAAEVLGEKREHERWLRRADERKEKMDALMWNEHEGMFFDYDFKRKRRLHFKTLAGYYPLWCGMADKVQAKRLVANLLVFETSGGLANTEKIDSHQKQWDWPNGWPGQQYIVVEGLLRCGFKEDAMRIAREWLALNREVFERTGKLWEKYDVVNRAEGRDAHYPTQSGFGWTNGVFLRLLSEVSPVGNGVN